MAARAQQVCTEEATKVNGFFHLYERAFKFQNQTYLVSYCVYTAATIDIQQIRHEDHAIATAAAKRLSTTLKMLESEAQQTPGIKRSIDIIKSHLNQWPEVAARQKTTTCSSGQPSWNSNQILASHRSSTSSGQVANGRNALPSYTGDSLAVGEGQLAANTRTIDLTGLDQPPGYQESQDSIGSLINEAMDVNPPWGDWASFNPSGGFVPEYHDEGWALFDPAVSYFNTD
ncbi:hypothetical protein N7456_006624 [Penicillium angulare]|uniref:Uncharacterized protein n=1 Tax=Penicillium angulare TaxID=116970 RepID=A0A9W9FI25_9EURO|nr:hypothetical protein N7456_006624 [Penicillium angulare]